MGTHAFCNWETSESLSGRVATLNEVHSRTPPWAAESTTVCKCVPQSEIKSSLSLASLPHGSHKQNAPWRVPAKMRTAACLHRGRTTVHSYSSSMSNSWCYELTKKVRATATDETRVGENVKNQPLKTHRQPSEFALLRSRILAKDRRPGTHEGIPCNRAKGIAPSHFTHSNLS